MPSSIVKTRCVAAFIVAIMLACPVLAQETPTQDTSTQDTSAHDTPLDRKPLTWSTDVQVLIGVDVQPVRKNSVFNPQNRIAQLADGQALIELRPDFSLAYDLFSFNFGPRLFAAAVQDDFDLALEETVRGDFDFYVNRWRAKVQLTPALSASYGREVLQWGNSAFRSPSNPFLIDNGRLNPIRELPGQEFAVVTYTPTQSFAVSFISNTRRGQESSDNEPFHATNALKVDYVGNTFNASIIGSKQQGNNLRLGGTYTYSASDAMLIYGEITAAQGSPAYYPEPSADAAGWRLAPLKKDSDRVFFTNLVGVSYTFPNRLVTAVEYLYNNEGYTPREARAFSSLGRSASALLQRGGPDAALGAQLLGQALNTGLRVERQNYLFVQAVLPEYRNRADFAVSYARALDADGGGTFSGYVTFSIQSRTQLFAVASYNHGPADSEFVRLQRFTLSTGVRLYFNR